ncbi:MAG: N-acetylmuramoyl-L-alanine amidase [Nocardiopsaceae bacterium]|nr:N-acetylmuramoyl-L-alanine amidase [Nocardiopsaceae bacterium]
MCRRRALLAAGACALLAVGLACSRPEPAPDCPATLNCRFIPAAYGPDGDGYGNYDLARRPADGLKIDSIVIHDTEATYDNTVSVFADPAHRAASNYVVQSSTGDVTEMVRPGDVAWATGNWYYNSHSVSIENEGFAAQPAWFTPAEYRTDAVLVRYLARKYGVPLDREHIVGHDNVGGENNAENKTQHTDPGPYWNWDYFMALVRGQSESAYLASQGETGAGGHHVVTISPDWAANQPPVADCAHGGCAALPARPANFVYLRTRPSRSAPLLPDPTMHPGGGPGTTKIDDWSATATAGDQYVLAGRRGDWTGIWFGGQAGWFYNPNGPAATARFTGGWVVTPRPGRAAVPVYGGAFPEAGSYPRGVSPRPDPPLAYRLRAGQSYVTAGPVPDDDYAVSLTTGTYDSGAAGHHQVIPGRTAYYQILFNHRLYYVHAADVTLRQLR